MCRNRTMVRSVILVVRSVIFHRKLYYKPNIQQLISFYFTTPYLSSFSEGHHTINWTARKIQPKPKAMANPWVRRFLSLFICRIFPTDRVKVCLRSVESVGYDSFLYRLSQKFQPKVSRKLHK